VGPLRRTKRDKIIPGPNIETQFVLE